MNKKAIGSVFVALALVLALLKSYIWVMVGLLIAAIVFACEEKQTKSFFPANIRDSFCFLDWTGTDGSWGGGTDR